MRSNLGISDVVMIYIQEKPVFYGQVADIEPDIKRGWYRVRLRSPFGPVEWILEDVHIFLGQSWTFQGVPYRMEKIGKREGEHDRKAGRALLRRVK